MNPAITTLDRVAPVSERATVLFNEHTGGHVMTVKHDNGVYRHLRFAATGTNSYWWEVVTWPGVLVIRGDMGSYTFSREEDMFAWFGAVTRINPAYWGQKVIAVDEHSPVKEWSREVFLEQLQLSTDELLDDDTIPDEDKARVRASIDAMVADPWNDDWSSAEPALEAVREWEAQVDGHTLRFEDVGEWVQSCQEYTLRFLWCLHAITYSIRAYRKARA